MRLKGTDELERTSISPGDVGLARASIDEITGGDAVENADIMRSILDGTPGPRRDIVVLNSAVALYAAGCASSFQEGADMAVESIDSFRAKKKLRALVDASHSAIDSSAVSIPDSGQDSAQHTN
jgi:anthranilate phosphoribosyltransferase